jgi:hypothetical protein
MADYETDVWRGFGVLQVRLKRKNRTCILDGFVSPPDRRTIPSAVA